jgi:hypothetical protein
LFVVLLFALWVLQVFSSKAVAEKVAFELQFGEHLHQRYKVKTKCCVLGCCCSCRDGRLVQMIGARNSSSNNEGTLYDVVQQLEQLFFLVNC